MADDRVATFSEAIAQLYAAKLEGRLADPAPSRRAAEQHFAPSVATDRLVEILHVARRGRR
jgi:hypothetical protein